MSNIKILIDKIKRNNEIFNELIKGSKEQIEIFNRIKDDANKNVKFAESILESNKELSEILINTVLPFFSKRGWFLSIDLYCEQMIFKLGKAIDDFKKINKTDSHSQENAIEEALKCLIRGSIHKIEKNVYEVWPTRESIFKDAFEAHLSAKYTLSIPIFLAQSDGICYEITGKYIFTQYNGTLQDVLNKKIVESKMTSLRKAFLELFLKPNSMTVNTKTRNNTKTEDPFFGPLNRHGVLHGEDLNYATEANSLRCISLVSSLLFLNTMFND